MRPVLLGTKLDGFGDHRVGTWSEADLKLGEFVMNGSRSGWP